MMITCALSARPRGISRLLCLTSIISLGGCSTLPNSGPTGHDIVKSISKDESGLSLNVVDISATNYMSLNAPVDQTQRGSLAELASQARSDLIEPGDKISIVIYEVGLTLFGSVSTNTGSDSANAAAPDFKSSQERVSDVVVDALGRIYVPYVGRLKVSGQTADAVGGMIERGLRGKSQNPQVLVSIASSTTNAAYVTGDVKSSTRIPLSVAPLRLTDSIVLAGGSIAPANDTLVRVRRGNRSIDERLAAIFPGSDDDLVLVPGDHIEVIKAARTYSVLGASSRVNQISFDAPTVSLAEAFARSGGPNDNQADPKSVFLFRGAPGALPAIYRINFMLPANYIIAQRISVQDKDIIYIANARANVPSKLVSIVNQLFSPIITTRAVLKN